MMQPTVAEIARTARNGWVEPGPPTYGARLVRILLDPFDTTDADRMQRSVDRVVGRISPEYAADLPAMTAADLIERARDRVIGLPVDEALATLEDLATSARNAYADPADEEDGRE